MVNLSFVIAMTVGLGMMTFIPLLSGGFGRGWGALHDVLLAALLVSIFAWFFVLAALLFFALPGLFLLRRKGWITSQHRLLMAGTLIGALASTVLGLPMMNDLRSVLYYPLQGALSGVIAAAIWWKFVESKVQKDPYEQL